MDLKKLAPWNWFKNEDVEKQNIPVSYKDRNSSNFPASFADLHREMNRMFESFFKSQSIMNPEFGFDNLLRPSLNIVAKEDHYDISVELPGIEAKDIKLEVKDDCLFISGEKKHENEMKDGHCYRSERSYGFFKRTLDLPNDVDQDNITASYENGVMKVNLPRTEVESKDKKIIEVKVG